MQVMRSDATGRMLKWTIEISQFDVEYKSRKSIKGQVLAVFVAELNKEWEEKVIGEVQHAKMSKGKAGESEGMEKNTGEKVMGDSCWWIKKHDRKWG